VLVGFAAFIAVAHRNLLEVANALFLPVTYTIGQSALSALIMLVLLSLILLALRNQDGLADPAGRRIYFRWVAPLTPLVWLFIAIGFAALLLGYLSLANYIAHQIFRTGMLFTALFLLHHLSDAAVGASFDPQSGFGRFTRRVTGLGERAIERIGLLFRIVVDFMLVISGLPLLFLLWTVTWVDFSSILNTAIFGVQIGEITLSPWSITVLLIILAGGILLTRLLIRWLDRRILAETRIDKGVQDSIRKGASYAGYILAAGFALTAAGFDFSNLAIIVGALGVGIGFGLQSIVNNFISGLILLAERPIRVGDWITLADGEGIVKKINVRSTEIETFDSCSIIVPNSNLIIQQVKNWTHKDTLGRVTVALTLDPKHDPETIRKLLLDTAREHSAILTYPAPTVVLRNVAAAGFDYELRAYVADIFNGASVASDIRFTLSSLFREKDITIQPEAEVMEPGQ
jgi:small-conductance mechanosensitive channel